MLFAVNRQICSVCSQSARFRCHACKKQYCGLDHFFKYDQHTKCDVCGGKPTAGCEYCQKSYCCAHISVDPHVNTLKSSVCAKQTHVGSPLVEWCTVCAACEKPDPGFVCGGCYQQRYCSVECQFNHWKSGHSAVCCKKV
jgi:hypothetical protein